MSELVIPDAVISPSGSVTTVDEPAYAALNPCPGCGSVPHDAPDGCHPNGEPRWVFDHCWKCGFRPNQVNTGQDVALLNRQFLAFQQYMARQTAAEMQHASLQPPKSPEDADKLRALLAEYEAQNAPQE